MSKQRRRYSKEFKRDALEYLKHHPGKTITEVAESLGIRRDMLSRWNREFEEDEKNTFPGNGNPRDEEIFRLKKEIAELKEEKEILKKAMAIFSHQKK